MKTVNEIKIILGSGSPRRKQLLGELGVDFKIIKPEISEHEIPGESPEEHVVRLASEKAKAIAVSYPDDLVIGADTIVVLDNKILGKPNSAEEAFKMLSELSGKTHTVYTGLSLVLKDDNIHVNGFDSTEVTFNNVTDDQIWEYIKSGEPSDKAGSYGIQGMGSFLVDKYDGELDTVIGFPTLLYKSLFKEVENCLKR
jgi:septum formation protein